MKVSEGRKAWVKNPERLKNRSTGFHFPQPPDVSGQVPVQVNIIVPQIHFHCVRINLVVNENIKCG